MALVGITLVRSKPKHEPFVPGSEVESLVKPSLTSALTGFGGFGPLFRGKVDRQVSSSHSNRVLVGFFAGKTRRS